MSITAKTTAALLAIFLALFAGAWAILHFAVLPSFKAQEAAAHDRDRVRLESNLREVGRDMRARALDYARWDDTYAYIQGRNRGYIAANFPDEWFDNYGADFVAFANNSNRVLWTRSRHGREAARADTALADQVVREANVVASPRGAPAEAIIWTADGPLLIGAARATPSSGTGQPLGLVIIGRRLDSGVLEQQLQLDLRFVSAQNVPQRLADRFAELDRHTLDWSTDDTLYTLMPLRDGEGLVGAVLAQQPRHLTALGAQTVAGALLLLTVMFAGVVGALWFVLHRLVTTRLAAIRRHFQTQDADARPIPHDDATDEIAQLTVAYNALAKRLRIAVESEQRALMESEVAESANRMKSDFLANISNEFRTPLNGVIGYAELIEEELSDEPGHEKRREDLQRIVGSARHLMTLVNEILDLSRIEGEKLDIQPIAFPVDELLHGVIDAAAPLARAQGNVLRLDFDSDLGVASTDQNRLRQCLVNVLAHACKRTRSGAIGLRAERRASPQGDILRFEITDGGPPLSKAQAAALFELFVRADDIPGSGARLGLAVTRKLLTLMGGTLDVANHIRRGCSFVMIVPATAPEVREQAA